jgi:hypothetical protein
MIDAASIRAKYPQLAVVERASHEIEISSPARAGPRVTVTLPHRDVHCEATASWANAKQVMRVQDGVGRVVEVSPFRDDDEPDAWSVPFDAWLDAWLALLAGGGDVPRPGRPVSQNRPLRAMETA